MIPNQFFQNRTNFLGTAHLKSNFKRLLGRLSMRVFPAKFSTQIKRCAIKFIIFWCSSRSRGWTREKIYVKSSTQISTTHAISKICWKSSDIFRHGPCGMDQFSDIFCIPETKNLKYFKIFLTFLRITLSYLYL